MIYPLHTLKSEMYENKLYIWGINVSSIYIFRKLMPYGIKISGFITDDKRFVGDTISNNRIVFIEDVFRESSIVFVDDVNSADYVYLKQRGFKVEVIERSFMFKIITGLKNSNNIISANINKLLKKKNIYIYGCGDGSNNLMTELNKNSTKISGFCTTDEPALNSFNGYPIKKYDVRDYTSKDAIIISVVRKDYQEQILDMLSYAEADVFVDEIISVKFENRFIEQVDYAIRQQRKIYLCVSKGFRLDFLKDFFRLANIKIEGYVYLEEDLENNIEDIYTLCNRDVKKTAVVTWEFLGKKQWEVLKILYSIGYSQADNSVIGMYYIQHSEDMFKGNITFVQDALVDVTSRFNNSETNGWKILGKSKNNKIMILGNSTSSYDMYAVESWCEKLYRKLRLKGLECTLYIGACPGDSVVTEFLRLIRDIDSIRPDIVISMSGVNDLNNSLLRRGFNHDFKFEMLNAKGYFFCSGIKSARSHYDFWKEIENFMRICAESKGATMFSFIQPCNIFMDTMNLQEVMQFDCDIYRAGAKDFYLKSGDEDDFINLWDLFHHKDEMFLDIFHYSDEANEILASIVLEKILPKIE